MSKHTPGPWTLRSHNRPDPASIDENDDWTIYGKNLEIICMEACSNKNAAADARLIAAAPTMLSLLERIQADADQTYDGSSNNGQAKISSELYQELCEFVARFKP